MSTATTIHPSTASLTSNDSAVLQALFDAESSPSSAVTIDLTLPPLPASLNISPETHEALQAREKQIISPLSSQTNPTRETIHSAITALDTIITTHPTYPSAYANRAQALRLLIEDPEPTPNEPNSATQTQPEQDQEQPAKTRNISSLLTDLSTAITLSTPRSPADPVSPLQARILSDAHTHRGYILLKLARQLKHESPVSGSDSDLLVPERFRALGPDQLEEMASRDFFFGGRFGNKVAQQLAVQTNPYAKMCGTIVKEAIRKEVEGS